MADKSKEKKTVVIDWTPDKNGKVPMYKQIVNYISSKISSGDWTIGSILPSQRELAEIFGVNRSTVVAALEELESFGVLKGETGKGTTVISNTWSLLISSATPDWGKYLRSGIFKENMPTIQAINKMEFEKGIIRLGTGELSPELYPTEMMKDIYMKLSQTIPSLNYLEPLGLLELREVLCERLKEKGIECKPSNIVITSGSLQALQLFSVCMLKQGSTVYCEAPSYIKSLQIFQSMGMRLLGVNMDCEGIQYWNMGTVRKSGEDALLYTIPSFHNPTGALMSEARRKDLFKFCSDNRLPIIEDDAYGDIWIDEEPPKPLKSMDENGMIIYLGTISKVLAPGLRIGWLVGSESVVERLSDVKMQTDYGASSVSQWMLREILLSAHYDQYLDEVRRVLKTRRDLMIGALEKCFSKLAVWEVPKGGFYIWLKFNQDIAMEKLFHLALKEGLLLNPGSIYDFKKNNALRLSYSYIKEQDIMASIEKLSRIVLLLAKDK